MGQSLLSPSEIAEKMVEVGRKKVSRTEIQTFLLGILAGAFISLGAYASNMVIHTMPASNYGWLKFVQGAVFPVGLILVLVAGAELFTGNNLIFVGVLQDEVSWSGLLKNWGLVYLGNFVGAMLFVFLIYNSGFFSVSGGQLGALHVKIAAGKTSLAWGPTFLRGILANFAVCLAVWMAVGAKTMVGKVLASWFPVMAFVAGGFEHSIANMYYISSGMLAKANFSELAKVTNGELTTLNASGFLGNLVASTLGNIVGGALLVGAVYWAIFNVKSSEKESEAQRRKQRVASK